RSPAHRNELRKLAALWRKMNVLTELAVPIGKDSSHKKSTLKKTLCRPHLNYRVAGAVLLLVVISLVSLNLWEQFDARMLKSTNGVYITQVGEQRSVSLSDGSAILLNTNTQVRVDYRPDSRDVRLLQGEAEFTVAKDVERPFRVYAGNERVQAVGTAFTVYIQDNKIDVTVTEGQVNLSTLRRIDSQASTADTVSAGES